jgi:hypothetical protein
LSKRFSVCSKQKNTGGETTSGLIVCQSFTKGKRDKPEPMSAHIADKPVHKPEHKPVCKPERKQPDGKHRKAPDDTQPADGTDRNVERRKDTAQQQFLW